jgi:hypothetical protein
MICVALLCYATLCFALLVFDGGTGTHVPVSRSLKANLDGKTGTSLVLHCFVLHCFALLCCALDCFALLCIAWLCNALIRLGLLYMVKCQVGIPRTYIIHARFQVGILRIYISHRYGL